MKISSISSALRFPGVVSEKRESGQDTGQRNRNGQSGNPKQDSDETEEFSVEEGEVEAAIQAFGSDSQAQLHGLTANIQGQGLGLKVVLKDGTGAVVRQFTGEEFLKVREGVSKDAKGRGKILDQKL